MFSVDTNAKLHVIKLHIFDTYTNIDQMLGVT
jgi:hypothetical protein